MKISLPSLFIFGSNKQTKDAKPDHCRAAEDRRAAAPDHPSLTFDITIMIIDHHHHHHHHDYHHHGDDRQHGSDNKPHLPWPLVDLCLNSSHDPGAPLSQPALAVTWGASCEIVVTYLSTVNNGFWRRKRKEDEEGHRVTIVTRSLEWIEWSRVWDWSLRAISASKRHHDLKAQVVTRLTIWIFGHLVTFSAYKSYKLLHKILPVQVWWTWVFLWKFHMDIFFGPFQMWMCWLILCGWNVLVVILAAHKIVNM